MGALDIALLNTGVEGSLRRGVLPKPIRALGILPLT
jgi:hypothetical protein